MIALPHWISPEVLRWLGLSLLHFLWQGAALAALATLLMGLCRKASNRYAAGVLCLVAMLAAPLVTYIALSQREEPSRSHTLTTITASARGAKSAAHSPSSSAASAHFSGQAAYQWLVQVWFLGVFLFSLRTAGGVILMERMRRRETGAVSGEIFAVCTELQNRLGIRRAVRFCETLQFDAPAVIGWFRPVVLLPVSAVTGLSISQLEAVIAHELAHIRRYDPFVNLFQIAVEALLFYHPGVWWLNKRIREERENCCDDVVVEICGSPLDYARALTLLEESRVVPAFALGANQGFLPARIRRLLGAPTATSSLRSAGLSAGLLFLCVAAAAGHALFGVAGPDRSPSAPQKIEPKPFPDPEANFMMQAEPLPQPAPLPQPERVPASTALPPQNAQEPVKPQSVAKESYIDSLKAAGLDNLSVDDLISLKVQGVTADYVRQMQSAGLKPNADELVGMKVQGITPDYVKEMRANGVEVNADDLIGLKVQGVTPEYIRQMKDLGLETNADSLIGMKVQGITPDYVREVRALGLKVDADGLIGMKVQQITPDYVKQMQSLGLHPDADELIGMKVQGITPEYVKQLQTAGFKVDVDDCISAKVAGVTPEFIEQVRSHGFKDLTMDELVELKRAGVLEK